MAGIELSLAQKAVVESDHEAFLVRAAAGSGKTRALVARYLKHVQVDGFAPDRLLTLTFTRKAAAEMKRRIVDSLREAGLYEAAQTAETGPIQTLHGFCERMLRENALAAGIDPDFEVADPAVSRKWQDEAVRTAIAQARAGSLEQAAIIEFAGARTFAKSGESRKLHSMIESALGLLRGGSVEREQVQENHRDPDHYLKSSFDAMSKGLSSELRQQLDEQDSTFDFWERVRTAAKSKRESIDWLPGPGATDTFRQLETRSARASCGVALLACRAWESLEARMDQEQRFDFSYLEYLAVRLVESNESVSSRLRRQYVALLIDEAQDLNPVQYRLIRSMRLNREMMVGDHQQSIYGFRLADVRLFQRRATEAPTLPLPVNYRSSASVLQAVDRLFGQLWPEGYESMTGTESESKGAEGVEWWDQEKFDSAQIAEWIQELTETEDFGDVAVLTNRRIAGEALHFRLAEVDVPSRILGGGESFFTRLEVRDLANLLTALVEPDNDFALSAVLLGPIVGASLDSVILLAQEGGIAKKLADFESPTGEDAERIAQFADWFATSSPTADRAPAWEALSKLFAETPYLERLARRPNGRQELANVRKLLSIAAQHGEMAPREFARFMREIQELKHREGDAASVDDSERAVSLLTIHKSKGLEFPVVVIAETDKSIGGKAKDIEVDRDLGLVATNLSFTKNKAWPIRDWIANKRKAAEKEEALRALYVAMTRARRRLILVGSKRKGSLGELVWSILGQPNGDWPGLKTR